MLRTFMSNGNLQFVYDINTNINPFFDIYDANKRTNDGVLIVDPYYTTPRPIFRTNQSIDDVNNDPELRKRMTKYFYDKFKTDWVYGSYSALYDYLSVKNGEVKIERSDKGKSDNDNLKAEFIINEIFSKSDMLDLLDKYVRQNDVNWYDLKTKHKLDVKDYIFKKIKSHMSKLA